MLACAVFTFLVLYLPSAFAHEEVEKSYDEIAQEILAAQNAVSLDKIDCGRVSREQFEELGDAIMGKMAGSDELHEQMDQMMGGEGSQNLHSMHVSMGENWLGCNGPQGMNGMMGNRMMPMMMGMMGNYYPGYFAAYDAVLLAAFMGWILFAAMLAIFVLFRKEKKRKK